MTVFKAYIKVISKNLPLIILYTVILVVFAVFSTESGDTIKMFENSKPAIMIINNDKDSALTKNLVDYISKNAEITDSDKDEETINDALFYREISYIIYIPQDYGKSVLKGEAPALTVKSTGDYASALTEMMLTRYIRMQNIYAKDIKDEQELINSVNSSLENTVEVEIMSKLDKAALNNQATYFNFAAYSIMSCILFIVCLVLSSFNEINVRKRTIISSMSNRKYNLSLILSSGMYALAVWIFFVVIGFCILGDSLFTVRGLIFIINSLIFVICILALAYMLSTFLKSKNAVTSIVNVIALGSSFLCGAFVPVEYLPDWVLKIAHILPAYWYINSNNILKEAEYINISSMTPVIINMAVTFGFTILFVVIAMIVSSKNRKIA